MNNSPLNLLSHFLAQAAPSLPGAGIVAEPANIASEMNFVALVGHASLPVKLVMFLLLAASVWSWWIIFRKQIGLRNSVAEAQAFEDKFWSGADLAHLFKEVSAGGGANGLAGVFEAGFREFARLRSRKSADPRVLLEGAQRSMRVALTREVDRLDAHLNSLATIGSVSPYVGLLGTVWGILTAFQGLGAAGTKAVTIATVAPGISEALVATAMGLFAAIPAVVFYNRFSNQVERIATRYDTFQEEFSSILQRQANIDEHH
jgi:biopolymer transport protein TolQ